MYYTAHRISREVSSRYIRGIFKFLCLIGSLPGSHSRMFLSLIATVRVTSKGSVFIRVTWRMAHPDYNFDNICPKWIKKKKRNKKENDRPKVVSRKTLKSVDAHEIFLLRNTRRVQLTRGI